MRARDVLTFASLASRVVEEDRDEDREEHSGEDHARPSPDEDREDEDGTDDEEGEERAHGRGSFHPQTSADLVDRRLDPGAFLVVRDVDVALARARAETSLLRYFCPALDGTLRGPRGTLERARGTLENRPRRRGR